MSLHSPLEGKALHEFSARRFKDARGVLWSQDYPTPTKDAAVKIPSPSIFDFSKSSNEQYDRANSIPTLAECAVHLELLEAILVLRRKVLNSTALDQIFGIQVRNYWSEKALSSKREKKWEKFVSLAVIRFCVWWESLGVILAHGEHDVNDTPNEKQFGSTNLPPLDVLMIWHTFMLNPSYYHRAISIHSCPHLKDLTMPWEHIHQIIDPIDRRYCLSESSSTLFRNVTGLGVDLLDFLLKTQHLSPTKDEILALFPEPSVAKVNSVEIQLRFTPAKSNKRRARPMTGQLVTDLSPLMDLLQDTMSDSVVSGSRIWASMESFATESGEITTTRTAAQRTPIFGSLGYKNVARRDLVPLPPQAPFTLLQSRETSRELTVLLEGVFRTKQDSSVQTFGDFYNDLHDSLESKAWMYNQPYAVSRIVNAIEWLIITYASRYSCPISLEGSALRQSKFIDQMGRLLWIRSPSLTFTLTNALCRYERFIQLFVMYPHTTLAPTPDIDLVWHTHQCAPAGYLAFSKARTGGKPIDHNDGLGQGPIDDARKRTGELYEIRYKMEYEQCFCWDCERLKEAAGGLGLTTDEKEMEKVLAEVQRDVAYHRAMETARRKQWSQVPKSEGVRPG